MTMTPFKLGSFSVAGCIPFAGVVVGQDAGERMIAVTALEPMCAQHGKRLTNADTVFGLVQAWDENVATLQAVVNDPLIQSIQSAPLAAVQIHAPLLYPRQIICAGANYKQHVIDLIVDQNASPETANMNPEERREWGTRMMEKRAESGVPYAFSKIPSTISGPYDPLVLPSDTTQPDWELELGVVISKAARRVTRENALGVIAGYTIVNDVTARERVHRADMKAIGSDWIAGKCAPGFLPTGPFLVPAHFVPDPQHLQLTLKLNGYVMQDESSADMIFGVARLIEYISNLVQLWPGDLICTGSPKGNGTHYNRYLRAGDVLEGTISGLGTMRNECVAEA